MCQAHGLDIPRQESTIPRSGSILNIITVEERMRRLDFVGGLVRGFLKDVRNEYEIKNIILRILAGCMSVAKEITSSNTPARRAMIFSQKIDLLCQTDPIYESGVEAAPSFKRLRGEKRDPTMK